MIQRIVVAFSESRAGRLMQPPCEFFLLLLENIYLRCVILYQKCVLCAQRLKIRILLFQIARLHKESYGSEYRCVEDDQVASAFKTSHRKLP